MFSEETLQVTGLNPVWAGSIQWLSHFNIHLEQVQNELQPMFVSTVSKFLRLAPFQTEEMQDEGVQVTNATLQPSSSPALWKDFLQ